MIRAFCIALASSVALAAGLRAQSAGTADLRFDRVGPRVDTMQVYFVQRNRQMHAGIATDEMRLIDWDGPAVLRVYRTELGLMGTTVDTLVTAASSLTGLSGSARREQPWNVLITPDSITGSRTDRRGSRWPIARAAGRPVYLASMFDVMVRAAPLARGYRLAVSAYAPASDSMIYLTAVVTGSEPVQVENGKMVDAWKVQMNFAGQRSTLWIDKQTRALARQTIETSPYESLLFSRVAPRR